MKAFPGTIDGILVIEPDVHRDHRGAFVESWNANRYRALGIPDFVQDNLVVSQRGVLRGLHYQYPMAQGKLVYVASGTIFDVAVDIRVGSPTFGRWSSATLSSETGRQVYISDGLAHGYVVLSEYAVVCYKCTDYYSPATARNLAWNDPAVGIEWPVTDPVLNDRDRASPRLSDIPAVELPPYEGRAR